MKITCTAACLGVWPPLILPSGTTTATGGAGVKGTFSTLPNPDGKGTQVLYNGWPLYFYAPDKNPGDVLGQGKGGKWFVATPDLAANA
jgi:predicted lipoprotein with Yx(FWY)xxD motif